MSSLVPPSLLAVFLPATFPARLGTWLTRGAFTGKRAAVHGRHRLVQRVGEEQGELPPQPADGRGLLRCALQASAQAGQGPC
ncbi:hypothetical protein [Deinococcus phoenicis]|uniref:hypothetical protein n=1 Tax=Deinococcus phoenicis TaxID=1476583 RepID=UPI0005592DBF|nr:hypothetical protein [Deinococcus phoenicis]